MYEDELDEVADDAPDMVEDDAPDEVDVELELVPEVGAGEEEEPPAVVADRGLFPDALLPAPDVSLDELVVLDAHEGPAKASAANATRVKVRKLARFTRSSWKGSVDSRKIQQIPWPAAANGRVVLEADA